VSTSHFFVSAAEEAARRNTGVTFVSFGGGQLAANLVTFQPLLFQPVHAAGLAAAHNVGEGVHEIGVVVDPRMFNVNGVINSFILGAKTATVRSGFDIHVRYIDSQRPSEARQALNEFRALGIDTVLSYLDTEHAIVYAEQIGMSVVGYSNNIAELAPNSHVAGFFLNLNNYLTEQISMLYHSTEEEPFRVSATLGAMATGHVHMSALNPNRETVRYETHRLVEALQSRVVNGTANIFADEIMDNHGRVQVPNGAILSNMEILGMAWLEYSVGSNFMNIYVPREEPPVVPLFLQLGPNAQAAREAAIAAAHEAAAA
jgi:basic membrane lipoprotein Med (substrate-binding protein (PBP1-ABC) superfamily)